MSETDDQVFTNEDLHQATNGYETLGPGYFAARRMVERLMAGTEADPFQKVVEKVTDDLRDALYQYAEDRMRGDMESNLQWHLCDMLDSTVKALLTGEKWAMERYPLSTRYDAGDVRAACARHGGEPLLMQRIADLEKDVARLTESLRWERDCRRY